MKKQFMIVTIMTALLAICTVNAQALSFIQITSNGSYDLGLGGTNQLEMTVEGLDVETGYLDFIFSNNDVIGSVSSSVEAIYFDFNPDFNISNGTWTIFNNSDVDFAAGTTPADLPAGNTVSFEKTWNADATAPPSTNGINVGESLTIRYQYDAWTNLEDFLDDYTLRVGLHVIALPDGSSESYVSTVPFDPTGGNTPVPEPATMLLFGSGIAGLAGFRMRRKQK